MDPRPRCTLWNFRERYQNHKSYCVEVRGHSCVLYKFRLGPSRNSSMPGPQSLGEQIPRNIATPINITDEQLKPIIAKVHLSGVTP